MKKWFCWLFGHRWYDLFDITGVVSDYDRLYCVNCRKIIDKVSLFSKL